MRGGYGIPHLWPRQWLHVLDLASAFWEVAPESDGLDSFGSGSGSLGLLRSCPGPPSGLDFSSLTLDHGSGSQTYLSLALNS